MKLKQVCAVAVLILALAFSTFAGEISCGGFALSPPEPTGQMDTPLTEIAVTIIQNVLLLS